MYQTCPTTIMLLSQIGMWIQVQPTTSQMICQIFPCILSILVWTRVYVANGQVLNIQNTGKTHLFTSKSQFTLNYVLHTPQATHNLLSVNKFVKDSCCYIILTPFSCLIKDLVSGKLLYQGPTKGGLYPIRLSNSSSNPICLHAKAPSPLWHQ